MSAPNWAQFGGIGLHWREDGDPTGAPVVFVNGLGTDLRIWDRIVPLMPAGLRILRYDMRGQGLSDCPSPPYAMGALISDLERLLDHVQSKETVLVGHGLGGMIAQSLAVKRLDQVRAMVLSNTATKIGLPDHWHRRIAGIETQGGLAALVDGMMTRWLAPKSRSMSDAALWRAMFLSQPQEGYVGACHAIAGTDLITPTSGLRLPTLAIAGDRDGATPPDLVRETAALIPGSRFALLRGTAISLASRRLSATLRFLLTFCTRLDMSDARNAL